MSNQGVVSPHAPRTPTSEMYEQWCEDFRSINTIFWGVPVLAMTLTGGVGFALGSINATAFFQSALLVFVAICNIAFIIVVWRLRVMVMQDLLVRIHDYEGRRAPRAPYTVVSVFCLLFGVVAVFTVYGAFHTSDLFAAAPAASAPTAAAPAAAAVPAAGDLKPRP